MLDKNLYELNQKFNILMNVNESDKERFQNIIVWAGEMMELSVKEKFSKNIFPKRGEVWTCHFGQNVGAEINNVRPCVVISNDLGNKKAPIVTVLPISNREEKQFTHVKLDHSSFSYMEDKIKGTVICEQIKAISKARLGRKIGELTAETMEKIRQAILISLELDEKVAEVNQI